MSNVSNAQLWGDTLGGRFSQAALLGFVILGAVTGVLSLILGEWGDAVRAFGSAGMTWVLRAMARELRRRFH